MDNAITLTTIRCTKCKARLFDAYDLGYVEIKCHRCNHLNCIISTVMGQRKEIVDFLKSRRYNTIL